MCEKYKDTLEVVQMRKKYPYVVLGILGGLIILIAFLIKPASIESSEFAYGVLLDIGLVVLTIVIVNFLWFILGGDPF